MSNANNRLSTLFTMSEVRQVDDDTKRYQCIWLAVIAKAIEDATFVEPRAKKKKQNYYKTYHQIVDRVAKRMAWQWLLHGGRDFFTVCAYAGVDHELVRERARALLNDAKTKPSRATGRARRSQVHGLRQGGRVRNTRQQGDKRDVVLRGSLLAERAGGGDGAANVERSKRR